MAPRSTFQQSRSGRQYWYALTRGLASGVGGGGGKVGAWTGERPNFAGELIQLGVRK